MNTARRTRNLNIYGDESSQTGHRFLLIGAVACDAERESRVIAKLDGVTANFRPTSEFKWSSIGKHEVPMYKSFVSALFDSFKTENVRYHCIVVDRTKANDAKYNEGDEEIGFSKYVFTLLNEYTARHKALDPYFSVYLDNRVTKHSLETTRRSLNRRAFLDYGHWKYPIFQTIQYVHSHEHRLVQAADVLTGAIAYIWNGHDQKPTAASHKLDMCDFIGARLWGNRSTLGKPTIKPIENRGIAIWHLDWEAQRRKALIATHKDHLLHFPEDLTLGELKAHGFEFTLTCPKCWRSIERIERPELLALSLTAPFTCTRVKCDGHPLLTLRPDPIKVPLFANPRKK